MNIVYFEGEYLPEHEAKISVSDRGLLMGDGVFVTVQVRNGVPLFLRRHFVKLREQTKKLYMAPLAIDESMIETLIEKNRAFEGIWRLKIYYTGGDDMAMHLPENRKGRLLMILKPYSHISTAPLKVGLYSHPIAAPQSGLKSLSHIARYMVMEFAMRRNLDDCITTTDTGALLETAFGNIFWIENNKFYTPHPTLPLHFGVTISVVSEMAKNMGMNPHYVRLPFSSLSDEACFFRSNSMGGIRPISHFEERPLARNLALEEELTSEYQRMWEQEKSEIGISL